MINETRGTGFGATHSLAYRRGDRSCIKGQTQCAGRVCNREHSLCLGFMKARAVSPIRLEAPEERAYASSNRLGCPKGRNLLPLQTSCPPHPPGMRAHHQPDPTPRPLCITHSLSLVLAVAEEPV